MIKLTTSRNSITKNVIDIVQVDEIKNCDETTVIVSTSLIELLAIYMNKSANMKGNDDNE